MLTKLIGVREFRKNMATLYLKAKKNNWRFIILNRNQPIFKIEPLDDSDDVVEKIFGDIAEAREDVKKGRIYTAQQIRKDLGL